MLTRVPVAGKLEMPANLPNITLEFAAVVATAALLIGCASARDVSPSLDLATRDTAPKTTASGPVAMHDPLAEIDPSSPAIRLGNRNPGNRYQRFVSANLDGLSEFWNRRRSDAWDVWAKDTLRDGDLVFVQSAGNMILGVIDFSELTREVTASPFTHMGIVAIESGEVLIYDTNLTGPGRKTFGRMMALPDVTGVAIKRLRPEYRQHIPGAVAYCRRVHERLIPFDKKLRLDNDDLYCTEMVELAFRSAGLPLSEPVRWDALPGFDKHAVSINAIRIANQAQPDEYVVVPGNDQLGIWASPALELVLDLTEVESPPTSPPAPQRTREE